MNVSDPNPPPVNGGAVKATGAIGPSAISGGHSSRDHFSKDSFSQDFRRFFVRGLAALMPTLITLWLLLKVWEFLWGSLGIYIIMGMRRLAAATAPLHWAPAWVEHGPELSADSHNVPWTVQVTGVLLAVILVYLVGLFAGNFLGRTAWRLAERAVMRIPLIRAIYPAVKQVTDFVLAEKGNQFAGARVVAVEPHSKGIWSIGLVTGPGLRGLSESLGSEMITVFVPSSPTAFSGYVLVVPRDSVIELPLTVEQAMRVLVSGGVIDPELIKNRTEMTQPSGTGTIERPMSLRAEGPQSGKDSAA